MNWGTFGPLPAVMSRVGSSEPECDLSQAQVSINIAPQNHVKILLFAIASILLLGAGFWILFNTFELRAQPWKLKRIRNAIPAILRDMIQGISPTLEHVCSILA